MPNFAASSTPRRSRQKQARKTIMPQLLPTQIHEEPIMSTAIAKNLMAEMKLLGMFAAYDQAVTDATRDQTGYSEFLDTLLQAEADYRQERKAGYRIKAAKFTLRPAFEDIDFTASRSISKAQIKELYSLQ